MNCRPQNTTKNAVAISRPARQKSSITTLKQNADEKKKIESEQPIEETSRRNGAFRDRVSLFHTFSHFVCCCFVFLSLSLSIPVLSSFQEPLHWYGFDTIVLHIPFSDICFETSPVVAGWNHRIPLPPTTKKILWTFNFF